MAITPYCTDTAFAVVQLSPRRWVVAERVEYFVGTIEYRAVTRPLTNRLDAQTVCTELATRQGAEYSPLTREHVLDVTALRGRTSLRSHLLQGSEN